jgi:hypothetical protein
MGNLLGEQTTTGVHNMENLLAEQTTGVHNMGNLLGEQAQQPVFTT